MGRHFPTLALLTFSAVLAAQVRVDVRLVSIIATVTDDRGRYVSNLSADDFYLEEDGRRQNISHFSQDQDVPVSVGILLDTSGSMERKLRTAAQAVDRFAQRIHKDDEAFVMTFASKPVLRQDFTSDRIRLYESMRRLLATGGTALYDALGEALGRVRLANHEKRAILIITDGKDTASLTKLDEVLQTIRESELVVYSLAISPVTISNKRDEIDMRVLRVFGETSGGDAFLISEGILGSANTQIDRVLDRVADELRSQYTIGYYPQRPDDGQYHSIRVRTKPGTFVRARKGYIATSS